MGSRPDRPATRANLPSVARKGGSSLRSGASTISLGDLDMMAVVRMSQAVSSEIVIERLIERLMMTLVEHAVAVRGLLLLPRGGQMRLVAEALYDRLRRPGRIDWTCLISGAACRSRY